MVAVTAPRGVEHDEHVLHRIIHNSIEVLGIKLYHIGAAEREKDAQGQENGKKEASHCGKKLQYRENIGRGRNRSIAPFNITEGRGFDNVKGKHLKIYDRLWVARKKLRSVLSHAYDSISILHTMRA